MSEPTLTIDGRTTQATDSSTVIPAPRAPVGHDGSRSVPSPRRAAVEPSAVAQPAELQTPAESAPSDSGAGSSWVEHPLRHRLRTFLRGRPLTVEQWHAASRAVPVARLQRSDPVTAQARLFTGLR